MIHKEKWKCKSGSQTSSGIGIPWKHRFIKGKWYDGEYETWSWEDGYRVNNGWRRYWAVNEEGVKEELSKAEFRIIFHYDIDEIRDAKIDEIIN